MNPDHLSKYAGLLNSAYPGRMPPESLSEDDRTELVLKGAVVTLELDGSDLAVDILYETARSYPIQSVLALAQLSLERLAEAGSSRAVDSLYRISVEADRPAVTQALLTHPWQPTRPALLMLVNFFHRDSLPTTESQLALLTQAFFEEASLSLQDRILHAAGQKGMLNWTRIIAAENELAQGRTAVNALEELIRTFPSFTDAEQSLALDRLALLAQTGPDESREAAQGAISRLFVEHENPRARQIALEHGYLPVDPEKRALFFFLAEDWQNYEALDFNHSMLVGIYEYAGKSLRRRLLDHGRRSGYHEWLRGSSAAGEVRWPADLTDADWETAVQQLGENRRWNELWQLAQAAPPLWSASMIDRLASGGWKPSAPEDAAAFNLLSRLAQECLANPLGIRPSKSTTAPAPLNSLALHPDGSRLAAGSSDQRIFTWKIPDLLLRHPPLTGPAPVIRAIAYSPDGSLLAAAANDHRIRVFKTQDGALVKTLEGHRALIRSLAVHPDGRLLASAGFDGSIRLWRFPYGPELKLVRPASENNEVFSLAIGEDQKTLLTAGSDRAISVWSLPDGVLLRTISGHNDTITTLALSPESDLVVSAGRDGDLRAWNFNSGRQVKTIANPGGVITALCMHPNDQVVIGASSRQGSPAQHEILFWNLSTGLLIDRVPAHAQAVTGLLASRTGEALYSCDTAGSLLAWDLRAFLTIRLPGRFHEAAPGDESTGKGHPTPGIFGINELQSRLEEPAVPPNEKKWLAFSLELERFRSRYDIELADIQIIPLGEFDIEL